MSQRVKNHEERIEQIFDDQFEDISRRMETLTIYKNYLEANLKFPVRITGIEDFKWEGYYIFGPGSKQEYDMLKKKRPSYKDIFSMSRIDSYIDEDYGLFAKVTRLSDKKRFQLPLADMKAVEEGAPEYQFLDDYSFWFINYQ